MKRAKVLLYLFVILFGCVSEKDLPEALTSNDQNNQTQFVLDPTEAVGCRIMTIQKNIESGYLTENFGLCKIRM